MVDFTANGAAADAWFIDPVFSREFVEVNLNGFTWTIGDALNVGDVDSGGSGDAIINDGNVGARRLMVGYGVEGIVGFFDTNVNLTADSQVSYIGNIEGGSGWVGLLGSSSLTFNADSQLWIGQAGGTGTFHLIEPGTSLSGGTVLVGTGGGGEGQLLVDGGTVGISSLIAGFSAGDAGTIALNGADASLATASLTIGNEGEGFLTMEDGAVVNSDRIFVGALEGGAGSVTIENAILETADAYSFIGDFGGHGTMLLNEGATWTNGLGAIYLGADGGTGTMELNHADAVFTSGGILHIGWNADIETFSSGSLTVNAGNVSISNEVFVGDTLNTFGELTVTGEDSSFTATEHIYVGNFGEGGMRIANGASVETPLLAAGVNGSGTLTMETGATLEVASFFLGFNADSKGVADISGTSTVLTVLNPDPDLSGFLNIALRGEAELTIRDGASVVSDRVLVGREPGAEGRITIEGGTLQTGDVFSLIGEAGGFGEVVLREGGEWNNGIGDIVFGWEGGTGRMELNGADAGFVTQGEVWLGANSDDEAASHGEWLISRGAVEINEFAFIGHSVGATGDMVLTGANSSLAVRGSYPDAAVFVGFGGVGTLSVLEGASVSIDNFISIGRIEGAAGTVLVDGAGSRLEVFDGVDGSFRVGRDGEGSLTVSNGGVVASENMEIGFSSTAEGQVLVDGAGARIELNDFLGVGGSDIEAGGLGSLEIRDGGVVDVGGAVRFWEDSSLTLDDGTLIAGDGVTFQGASVAGTGLIQGDVTSSNTTYDPGTSPGHLTIEGNWSLASSDTIKMELGGALPSQNDQFTIHGDILLGNATFELTLLPSFLNSYIPPDSEFTLISNPGAAPIGGQFAGLAQGGEITIGEYVFQASYSGGSGNDFTLTMIESPEVFVVGPVLSNAPPASVPQNADFLVREEFGVVVKPAPFTRIASLTFEDGSLLEMEGQMLQVMSGIVAVLDGEAAVDGSSITTPGDLVKEGPGTLVATTTLAGNRILIEEGTLQIGDGVRDGGIITNEIINNTELVFNTPGAVVLDAPVGGAGGLRQSGAGPLVLLGDATHTGGTIVADGSVLRIGDGGTTGSFAGDVENDGTLVFDRADPAAFAGDISGTGGVVHAGPELLVLSGNNTHSGGTSVNGGTLGIGSAGALGSGPLQFAPGSALDNTSGAPLALAGNNEQTWNQTFRFLGSDDLDMGTGDVTLRGFPVAVIEQSTLTVGGLTGGSGAGPVFTKEGGGTLAISGESTYTGLIRVREGELRVGAGGTTGSLGGGLVDNESVLAFDRSDATEFDGTVRGGGVVEVRGSGTLLLSGDNRHTGGTVVLDGRVEAGSAGALGRGDVLLLGGELASGGGLSQVRVQGDLFWDTGGTISLTLSHNRMVSEWVAVFGAVSPFEDVLGGPLVFDLQGGGPFADGDRFLVMFTAGGFQGLGEDDFITTGLEGFFTMETAGGGEQLWFNYDEGFDINGFSVFINPIPEPSAALLILVGGAWLVWSRRKMSGLSRQ